MITLCLQCCRRRLARPIQKHLNRVLSSTTTLRFDFEWNDSIASYVKHLVGKSEEYSEKVALSEQLTQKEMKRYQQEIGKLQPVVDMYREMESVNNDMEEMNMWADGGDQELQEQVQEEVEEYLAKLREIQTHLIEAVIPKDQDDENNAVIEIRSGAGGQESSLFAAEVFGMYMKLASNQNWQFEVISQLESTTGGITKATGLVSGKNVFGVLKYESGVHRIQRVPTTETAGRIHTSTIAVSVLPQPSYTDYVLNMKDVKVDTYKASGPGGQHVNTTDSSVRMTHIPTGIVVTAAGRSQIKNRQTAERLLAAQVYDRERIRRIKQHNDAKRDHLNNLDRSQRIRTYNFPQDRITDHRVKESVSNVSDFLNGGGDFLDLSSSLAKYEKLCALEALCER